MSSNTLHEKFGDIDIYLFDQLLRGRIAPGARILDAGCGGGRNLVYLLRQGFEVFAADSDAQAIYNVQRLAAALAPTLPVNNFRVETIESMSFPEAFADVVLSSAVLHFAHDDEHFFARWCSEDGARLNQAVFSSAGWRPRSASNGKLHLWEGDASCCPTAPNVIWWMHRCSTNSRANWAAH